MEHLFHKQKDGKMVLNLWGVTLQNVKSCTLREFSNVHPTNLRVSIAIPYH